MSEVQKHGFIFEQWIKENFFINSEGKYSDKWDIKPECNINPVLPKEFHHLPVSIKTAKNKSPIGLGDAIRQYDIDSDFLLIVGFWKQANSFKFFVSVEAARIELKVWKNLWSPLKRDALIYLDSSIKDTNHNYSDVRKIAQGIKRDLPQTKIVLNPKIDSKRQRRLQCSLPYNIFWSEIVKKEPYENLSASFFNVNVPNPIKSLPRKFNH